jgi:hypothetical protein
LPHVRAALVEQQATIAAGAAAPDAKARTERNLFWRSTQLLFLRGLADTVDNGGPTSTASAWRKTILHAQLLLAGYDREAKASPTDYAAIAAAAGWAPVTKATSSWPFTRPPPTAGHMELVNVYGLVRALEAARGEPLADADPAWTVFEHLFAHEPAFIARESDGMTLQQRVDASDGPLRLGVPGPPLTGLARERAAKQAADLVAAGVLTKLTPAEIADKSICAVISPSKIVVQGKLKPSDAAREALEALAAEAPGAHELLVAAVSADADEIVEALRFLVAARPADAPHLLLEEVLDARKDVLKVRACCNGRPLGEHIHSASFSYTTFDEVVAQCARGSVLGKADGHSFFYVVGYADHVKRFLCVDILGDVYAQDRMSMGVKDSPLLASGLSAFICEIVTLRTAAYVTSYIDDIMNAAMTPESGAATQAVVLETMAAANVPEARAKRMLGTATPILGRVVDTVAGVTRLPHATVRAYAMHFFIVRRLLADADPRLQAAVTTASVSSLSGKLSWWSGALLRARCHLGGLIKAANGDVALAAVRGAVGADLLWWEQTWASGKLSAEVILFDSAPTCLVHVRGGGVDEPDTAASAVAAARGAPRTAATDAGQPGGGAICNGDAFYFKWATDTDPHSDYRETLTMLLLMRHKAGEWAGVRGAPPVRVLYQTDNFGNVFSINYGRARRAPVSALIDEMYDIAEQHNFVFAAAWLPREANTGPDALSKCESAAEARAVAGRLGLKFVA